MKIFKDRKSCKTPMMHQRYHQSKNIFMYVLIICNIIILTKLSWDPVYTWLNNIDQITYGLIGIQTQGSGLRQENNQFDQGCQQLLDGATKLKYYTRGERVNMLTCQKINHISINKEKVFEEHFLSSSCCSKNNQEIMKNPPKFYLAFSREIKFKTKSSSNPEILSTKSEEIGNSLITE